MHVLEDRAQTSRLDTRRSRCYTEAFQIERAMSTTTFSFQVDEQLKEQFLRLADDRNSDGEQLLREFMRDFVKQASDPEYDAWFQEQVQIGIDDANAGRLISSDEVEAEFAARRAETERQLKRKRP